MDPFLEKVYLQLLKMAINYRVSVVKNDMNVVKRMLKEVTCDLDDTDDDLDANGDNDDNEEINKSMLKDNCSRKHSILDEYDELEYMHKCKQLFMLKMSESMLRPNHHYHVVIDDVSHGLKHMLLRNDKQKDIMHGGDVWDPDFFKIDRIYPTMKSLTLFNQYRFSNKNVRRFIKWLDETENKEFSLLKFVYFDYSIHSTTVSNKNNDGKSSKKNDTDQMCMRLDELRDDLRENMQLKGWEFKEKELNGYGYRIVIQRNKN